MKKQTITPAEIAESFINGNLTWVKEQCKKDPVLVMQVLSELPEQEKDRFIKWVNMW